MDRKKETAEFDRIFILKTKTISRVDLFNFNFNRFDFRCSARFSIEKASVQIFYFRVNFFFFKMIGLGGRDRSVRAGDNCEKRFQGPLYIKVNYNIKLAVTVNSCAR